MSWIENDVGDERKRTLELVDVAVRELRSVSGDAEVQTNRVKLVRAAVALEDALRALRGDASGREIILELLREASPRSVDSNVLRHASGIQEFARRIRELREEGYDIETLGTSYRLVETPDDGSDGRARLETDGST